MTDVPPTYIEQRRALPQSTVQAAAQISGDVVQGLGRSPAVLAIVILVAITVGAAIYFLQLLINGQQMHLHNLLMMQQGHLKEIIADNKDQTNAILSVHNREFDAMIEIIKGREPIVGTQATPPPVRTSPR